MVEIGPHGTSPGSNLFLNERIDFGIDTDDCDNVISHINFIEYAENIWHGLRPSYQWTSVNTIWKRWK